MVCVLGTTVSDRVCCLHANPLLRMGTRYIAREPASWSVGGAAQARISGLTCGLEGPRASYRPTPLTFVMAPPASKDASRPINTSADWES